MSAVAEHWERDALPRGAMLHGYRIDAIIGRGGFGITYRASDAIDQVFAVKEYMPRQFAMRDGSDVVPTGDSTEPLYRDCLARFVNEAKALKRLSAAGEAGAGVVKVMTLFETNGTAYIVMEYLPGQPLDRLIRAHPEGLPAAQLQVLTLHLLDAVARVHDAGILHRDIKPANILLREDGRPVLIDFGATRGISQGHTATFTQIFSEGYAPIEQFAGAEQGPFSDIYALGSTLYSVVGGKTVDSFTRHQALMLGKPDPQRSAAEVGAGRYDPRLLHLIDQAMLVAPERRPQSIAALRALLEADRAENRSPAPRPDAPSVAAGAATAVKPSRRSWLPLIGGGLAIAVAAVAGVWLILRPTDLPPPAAPAQQADLAPAANRQPGPLPAARSAPKPSPDAAASDSAAAPLPSVQQAPAIEQGSGRSASAVESAPQETVPARIAAAPASAPTPATPAPAPITPAPNPAPVQATPPSAPVSHAAAPTPVPVVAPMPSPPTPAPALHPPPAERAPPPTGRTGGEPSEPATGPARPSPGQSDHDAVARATHQAADEEARRTQAAQLAWANRLDQPLGERVSGPPLFYPPVLAKRGGTGSADIDCAVDVHGRPNNCRVVEVRGPPVLGNAALNYIKASMFRPPRRNGVDIADPHHRFHVEFKPRQ